METVTAKLPMKLVLALDALVEKGQYANRSEAVRDAVRRYFLDVRLKDMQAAVEEDLAWALHGD